MLGLTAPNTTTESRNGRRREPRSLPDKQWPARGAIAVMRRRDSRLRRLLVAITLASLVMIGFTAAAANPGALDTRFGRGGKVIRALGPYTDLANAVALQRDGRIVIAGDTFHFLSEGDLATAPTAFALARVDSDGGLDPTFGAGGIVTTKVGSEHPAFGPAAYALALQPDGKILAAGVAFHQTTSPFREWNDFALVRYRVDGSLDPSFGNAGEATTGFGPGYSSQAMALAIDGSGRIIAVGSAQPIDREQRFALARYQPDGALDSRFGHRGALTTKLGLFAYGHDLAQQPNGKVIVAGIADTASGKERFALARYLSGR